MAETENKIVSQKEKKRRVKALFSYNPVNIDELQLKVNDVLEVIEETEEGWWKGKLNGSVGMFPSNFVIELDNLQDELSNHTINELSPTKSLTKMKNADILESNLKHDTQSPLTRQESKTTVSSNNEDVDSSKISNSLDRKGFVSKRNVADATAPRLPPKPVREQARVIYPYTANNEDELSMKEGDIITVISKEVEDKGWWKGELNNKMGVFPDNFVQLIKTEEQKKPERPDKPSSALTSRARSSSSDKPPSEFSPKIDKKVVKTPPVKPPPPEIHKKESERPIPPFPTKKPQLPHPMKKPSRSSLGSKFSGFSPPSTLNSAKPPPVPETPPVPPPPAIPAKSEETKSEVLKNIEKFSEKDKKENQSKRDSLGRDTKRESLTRDILREKDPKKESREKETKKENKEKDMKKENKEKDMKKENKEKDMKKESQEKDIKKENQEKNIKKDEELGFEGLESSGKKLVHLTANRAKVPNRRPPSHVFLRDSEKENGIPLDPRRLSEPLLSEMKFLHQLQEVDSLHKTNAAVTNEVKAKIPPSRPLPPSIKGNKPAIQGSVILTKTISSEECIVKAPEPIKKSILPDASSLCSTEILQPKKVELPMPDFKVLSSDREVQELKESLNNLMTTMVSQIEFNELAKQVKELKEGLEKCNNTCMKTINDLKTELESERKMRQALENELQQVKEKQTT